MSCKKNTKPSCYANSIIAIYINVIACVYTFILLLKQLNIYLHIINIIAYIHSIIAIPTLIADLTIYIYII